MSVTYILIDFTRRLFELKVSLHLFTLIGLTWGESCMSMSFRNPSWSLCKSMLHFFFISQCLHVAFMDSDYSIQPKLPLSSAPQKNHSVCGCYADFTNIRNALAHWQNIEMLVLFCQLNVKLKHSFITIKWGIMDGCWDFLMRDLFNKYNHAAFCQVQVSTVTFLITGTHYCGLGWRKHWFDHGFYASLPYSACCAIYTLDKKSACYFSAET